MIAINKKTAVSTFQPSHVLEYGLQLTMVTLTVVCGTIFCNGGDKVCSFEQHLAHLHG